MAEDPIETFARQILPSFVWNGLRRMKSGVASPAKIQMYLNRAGYTVARKADYYSPGLGLGSQNQRLNAGVARARSKGSNTMSHAERNPELVAPVRQVRRSRPKGGQRSLREISADLAQRGIMNEGGKAYSAAFIVWMKGQEFSQMWQHGHQRGFLHKKDMHSQTGDGIIETILSTLGDRNRRCV